MDRCDLVVSYEDKSNNQITERALMEKNACKDNAHRLCEVGVFDHRQAVFTVFLNVILRFEEL